MVIPLVGPYLAFRDYRQLHHETQSTFELLADLLDRRDPYTASHSQRVAHLTMFILDEFPELSADERDATIAAARIHDLGKVAERSHFTQARSLDRRRVRRHPASSGRRKRDSPPPHSLPPHRRDRSPSP
ncbi:HD domain-containing protein [Thermomicrobium sp.]|uniref:HD domain-containing protein n=1 Tax=Thermomicrobium sp. TaxID=1969469 RepID=UPI00338EFA6D